MSQAPDRRNNPFVSIIIPTFNSERYVRECLESVFAQTFRDYEVIVVDDGSTDQTVSILQGLGERIRLVARENRGPAAARNEGIRLARGKWVAFLDSDDLWLPHKLQVQAQVARDHPEYGLITTEASSFDEAGIREERMKASLYEIRNGRVAEHLLFGNWVQTSGVMIRRECFEKVGYFHEERGLRGTDWIMWMQIAAEYPIYFIAEPLAKVRFVPQSFSHGDPEKQFWTLFRALDIIQESIPTLSPRLIRKRKCDICFKRAVRDAKESLFANARKKLWYSLRLDPLQPRAWALVLACASSFTWQVAVQLRHSPDTK